MTGYIGVTDRGWYDSLRAARQPLEEVNFWQPSGGRMARLEAHTPFFFKLHKRHGGAICGFAFYARGLPLRIREAWEIFGASNGVPTLADLVSRIQKYRRGSAVGLNDNIGCHLLLAPVFFPPEQWIAPPSDWADNIVQGMSRPFSDPEMARIWQACRLAAASLTDSTSSPRALSTLFSDEVEQRAEVRRDALVRVGQGVFRASILDAYGRSCAVSTEHSIPALDAAHIVPYGLGGTHDVANGLLLRADIHKLFDAGYVTVTPAGRFVVSNQLKHDFDNGRVYYDMHGRTIGLPKDPKARPSPEFLRWHNDTVFQESA